MNKHVKFFKENKLKSDEKILDSMEGWIGKMMGKEEDTQHNGALILTDSRVVFFRKGWFGEQIRQIKLEKISSIDNSSFMGFKSITFHTSNDEIEFKTFEDKKTASRWQNTAEELIN